MKIQKSVLVSMLLVALHAYSTAKYRTITKLPISLQQVVTKQVNFVQTHHLKAIFENVAFVTSLAGSLWLFYLIVQKGLYQCGFINKSACHETPLFFTRRSWNRLANLTREISLIGAGIVGLWATFYLSFSHSLTKNDYLSFIDQIRLCFFYLWPFWLIHDTSLLFLHTTQTSYATLCSDLIRISKFYLPFLLGNKRVKAFYQLFLKRYSLDQLKIDSLKEHHGVHSPGEAPLHKKGKALLMPPGLTKETDC